ncbi:phage tail protein [Amycolatopsis sp. H20-H5]|uniref:phage tail protein n=1 Tax=Amycolatopsis sp. H20-H5 TaxID=3046309 RepID=UPI002DB84C82|nr:phage tail protein [Amycolatopsis sp. H20-H5]MEC3981858.1 phage tail protein [Amycolatopsis sp. H20-H5]
MPSRSMLPGQLAQGLGLSGDVGMSHQFRVSIDSGTYDLGTWTKVSGLAVGWNACQYRCGENEEVLTFPGNAKYGNVKLARAACSDSRTVQDWLVETTKNHTPLSGDIQLINSMYLTVASWQLKECYPISWSVTEFDAGNSRPVVEALEMSHTGFLSAELKVGF